LSSGSVPPISVLINILGFSGTACWACVTKEINVDSKRNRFSALEFKVSEFG
jgi:hypothetical protein